MGMASGPGGAAAGDGGGGSGEAACGEAMSAAWLASAAGVGVQSVAVQTLVEPPEAWPQR